MAWSLVRASMVDLRFIHHCTIHFYPSPVYTQHAILICGKNFTFCHNSSRVFLSNVFCEKPLNLHLRYLCSSVKPRNLCWEVSSRDILLKNLESCLNNHQMDEAWDAYTDYKRLYGLPDNRLLTSFITELSYSPEPKWLQRACDITLFLSKEKSNLLHVDLLRKLSLCLARAQMPVPTSMILRIMIEKENFPPSNLLGTLILHMVKKETGAYLASNILIQICDHFQHLGPNRSTNLIRPDTIIFNIVLDACSSYKLTFKAQQIIELMSQVGLTGDAHTIVTIARIHMINGQRDELKKFKYCVDEVAVSLGHHYFQFYDSLMSLHFKFNDMDAACKLIFDMIGLKDKKKGPHKPFLISIGSPNLRIGLKLQVLPHLLHISSLVKLENSEGLVMYKNGKLVISNKTLAKIIIQYKKQGRISELSKLLYRIQTEQTDSPLISDVIDACIHVGWLETAHDILDDMEREGNIASSGSYQSLLTAYYEGEKNREAQALLKQIKKAGITLIKPDKPIVCSRKSDLTSCLVHEMKEWDMKDKDNTLIYELNSSIYFFTKARMIDDALKTYKSMQGMNIHPNVATYIHMVNGCSSLEMYREISILWGDIKRGYDDGNLLINRDLYELLILNFLKGGYFERVMEVIGCMKKHGMYADKWLYRSEFLKVHKDLYSKLKSSNARTEAQGKRLAHVLAFKKWAGID